MIRFAPAPILTLCALAAFAALIALGGWQWRRMAEKEAIFAEIARERAAPAQSLAAALAAPTPFARVAVPALTPATVATWGPAGRVFQAAPLPDGGAILVETARGGAGPPARLLGPLPGVLRRIEREGPANAPARGEWFHPDPAMGAALGGAHLRPDWYVALDEIEDRTGPPRLVANPRADPRAVATPPERHFGYALTWWGLAAGLVAIYAALHVQTGRLKFA